MSYCGTFPNAESESHILVDACLARVRVDAGLDDESVLPPLHALIGKPTPLHTRFVVGASMHKLPSAEAIVKSVAGAERVERSRAETHKTQKSKSKSGRIYWPIFVCGFIAGTFGGIAVMKSPIGQRPSVQRVVKTARSHAEGAFAATVTAAKTRIMSP